MDEAQAENAEAERDEKIQALETQLASALTEAKGHQKRAEKNRSEGSRLESLESRIETLTSMTAEVLDKEADYSEDKKRKSDVYLDRLKGEDEQRRLRVGQSLDRRLKDVGLVMQDSEETQRAWNKWLTGDVEGCSEEVDRVIETRKTEASKLKETEKSSIEEQVEERVRQKMEEKGLLGTDTGGPQGAGGKAFTTKEIDKMDIKEYREKFPGGYSDVLKAIQEGRIKE